MTALRRWWRAYQAERRRIKQVQRAMQALILASGWPRRSAWSVRLHVPRDPHRRRGRP